MLERHQSHLYDVIISKALYKIDLYNSTIFFLMQTALQNVKIYKKGIIKIQYKFPILCTDLFSFDSHDKSISQL